VDGNRKEHGMKTRDEAVQAADKMRESFGRLGDAVCTVVLALDNDRRTLADFIEANVQGSQVVRRPDASWYVIT
jgi:hypothetical protein